MMPPQQSTVFDNSAASPAPLAKAGTHPLPHPLRRIKVNDFFSLAPWCWHRLARNIAERALDAAHARPVSSRSINRFAFQCLGERIVYVTRVPIHGPVTGIVLFPCLSASPALAQRVGTCRAARGPLRAVM